jgi:adenylosuccinate synthase
MSGNLAQVNQAVQDINNAFNVKDTAAGSQGAGRAYQAVAQSMAIAVQDSTDYLRNMGAISMSAMAVLTEQMVEAAITENDKKVKSCETVIGHVQKNLTDTATFFKTVGTDAGTILKDFPNGSS